MYQLKEKKKKRKRKSLPIALKIFKFQDTANALKFPFLKSQVQREQETK